MTLINDSLENVKASLLVAIKNQLTETYPSEFGDYTTSRGDVYTKVFWADTIRYQPKHPYCMLSENSDVSEGYDEISYIKSGDGVLLKKTVTRSFLEVAIDIFDMGNEQIGRSALQADTFAHKVARQLRKYFNGDGKLDWFNGNEYYSSQIGITVLTDIDSTIDWADTDTFFRYTFTIQLGWDDIQVSNAELANGVEISLSDNQNTLLDKFTINFKNNT